MKFINRWTQEEQNKIKQLFDTMPFTYVYMIGGLKASIIFDYLSKLNCPWKLARKWENPEVLKIVEGYKLKYPQYFNENNGKSTIIKT
ncbi:MAG: hypothetical protein AABY22_22350 [Nanoarchaeota archaeon]